MKKKKQIKELEHNGKKVFVQSETEEFYFVTNTKKGKTKFPIKK
jgi:hypothetical protein